MHRIVLSGWSIVRGGVGTKAGSWGVPECRMERFQLSPGGGESHGMRPTSSRAFRKIPLAAVWTD